MMQAALKGVVRAALEKAVRLGALPGDHHFFVTFRTRTPGVEMPDHLKDRFTDEMTIVIQHQYWDLKVDDEGFGVLLRFGGQPYHLQVPFAAITRFVDPSVNFGLIFEETPTSAISPKAPPRAPAVEERPPEGTVVSLDAFRRK
jgi:hypothetical protein